MTDYRKTDDAIEEYERALKIEPNNAEARHSLEAVKKKLGN